MTTPTAETTDEREAMVGKVLAELPAMAAQKRFRAVLVVAVGDESTHLSGYLAETTGGDNADTKSMVLGLLTLLERLGMTIEANGDCLILRAPSVH